MRRASLTLIALLMALLIHVGLIYLLVTRIWPLLPLWANAIAATILALSVVASPLLWLLRLGDMKRPPSSSSD